MQSNNEIKKLSELFTPETLQLLYQIVINGKKDIYLAPDLLTGFNTTLLRMLAFFPSMQSEKLEPKLKEKNMITSLMKLFQKKKISQIERVIVDEKDFQEFDGDWHESSKKSKAWDC